MARPIGLVVAFPQEISPFLKHLRISNKINKKGVIIYETSYLKHNLVIAISGLGKQNARTAAQILMDAYHPQGLISTGFSGALRDDTITGIVLLPERILDLGKDGTVQRNHQIEQDWWKNQLWNDINFFGDLLCTERVIVEAQKKQELGEKYHATLLDMESAGVAEVTEKYRIPFCAIRVITDTLNENLPMDFNQYLDDNNNIQYRKILLSLIIHPSRISALFHMMKQNRFATKRLSRFLFQLFGNRENNK